MLEGSSGALQEELSHPLSMCIGSFRPIDLSALAIGSVMGDPQHSPHDDASSSDAPETVEETAEAEEICSTAA